MRVDSCEFPDDLLYDEEGLVWVRPEPSGEWVLGITSIHSALAGPLAKVTHRDPDSVYERGRSLGTLESGRYFGAIRTPVAARLVAVNDEVVRRPKLLSEDPYGRGWFARVRPVEPANRAGMADASHSRERLASQVATLRVHCFSVFPDHEMFEIGTECAAVISKLDELLEKSAPGEVVHLVSDDWTAPAEMENWSMRTGNPVVESRKEGTLFHFLVRKAGEPARA